MTPCPVTGCSGKLKSGKRRLNDEGNVERRRYCCSCNYGDLVVSKPEVVLWTQITRGPPANHSVSNGDLQASALLDNTVR